MRIEEKIAAITAPVLAEMEFALVRVRLAGETLQIMAEPQDEAREMTVDDCAAISRNVSALLDAADPIKTAYALEISSPGLARPLLRPEDYTRFNGALARLNTRDLIAGRRRFRGRLGGLADDGAVLVETEDGVQSIPFDAIEKARLDPAEIFAKGEKRTTKPATGPATGKESR